METCEKATGRKASIESIDRCTLLLHRKKMDDELAEKRNIRWKG
jgi:hypothetical protein